ncbi:MAG: hypothetical protein CVV27_19320 [Candidatus Melainabacteria bacterium HGW-Melainabacteria-1]|nr:MAG: hypothetical protein CVV27_19320 [Candidatus Melainabacteria bacterium HGW-Melainabacteria-1]
MAKFRYRYLRTMYDKIVGVAVEKPGGDLIMQIGNQMIEFDKGAPKLEMLNLYVEKIADMPKYKPLNIYDVSNIYTTDRFVNCKQLMDEGKNFLVE